MTLSPISCVASRCVALALAAVASLASGPARAQVGLFDPEWRAGGRTLIPATAPDAVATQIARVGERWMLMGRCTTGGIAVGCVVRLLSNGDLDVDYGTAATGHVVRQQTLGLVGGGNASGLIHADGRVSFVVDHPTLGIQVARLGADGRTLVDPPRTFQFAPSIEGTASGVVSVLKAPDDGLYVVGYGLNAQGHARVAVAKLRADLSLDDAFGVEGRRLVDFEPLQLFDDAIRAAVLGPDGRIVVAYRTQAPTNAPLVLLRLDSDGDPDLTFGVLARTSLPGTVAYDIAGLAMDDAGRIVYAGSGNGNFFVGRLLGDGSEDPGFGAGLGRRIIDFASATGIPNGVDFAYRVLVQPDAKLVICGSAQRVVFPERSYLALARLTPDGALDPSFAGDGLTWGTFASEVFTNNDDAVRAMLLDDAGNLMVAGVAIDTSNRYQFGVARIRSGLMLDSMFRGGFE